MILRLAALSPRRILALWAVGLLIEAALLSAMFIVLVRPEPPLVAQLRGVETGTAVEIFAPHAEAVPADSLIQLHPAAGPPVALEDSFYTVVHWPLTKPLLAGGGRVVAVPMHFWWIPVLYVGSIPLLLVCLTGISVWARRKPGSAPLSV